MIAQAQERQQPDGTVLAALRGEAGLTQAQLASAMGCSRARVSQLENQIKVRPETRRAYEVGVVEARLARREALARGEKGARIGRARELMTEAARLMEPGVAEDEAE